MSDTPANGEVLYKLGQIEALVKAQNDTMQKFIEAQEAKNKEAEARINSVETELKTWKTRVYTVVATFGAGWAIFSDLITTWVGGMFNHA